MYYYYKNVFKQRKRKLDLHKGIPSWCLGRSFIRFLFAFNKMSQKRF